MSDASPSPASSGSDRPAWQIAWRFLVKFWKLITRPFVAIRAANRREDRIQKAIIALRNDLTGRREEIDDRLEHAVTTTEGDVLAIGACVNAVLSDARDATAAATDALKRADQDSPIVRAVQSQSDSTSSFVERLLESLSVQRELASKAKDDSDQIVAISRQVAAIARSSKLLSFNAQIEAARLGEAGRSFAVVAEEMVKLTESVNEANRRVARLAGSLAQRMPQLVDSAEVLVNNSQDFEVGFEQNLADLRSAESELTAATLDAIRESEQRADRTLTTAQKALSHLQFQDPMAQSLRRVQRLLDNFGKAMTLITQTEVDREMLEKYAHVHMDAVEGSYYQEKRRDTGVAANEAPEPEKRDDDDDGPGAGDVIMFD